MHMKAFQTEFEFMLPKGYVDPTGTLHKQCIMRLATAGDEIAPLRDPRVQKNPEYLAVILLSRVIVKLGTVELINTHVIESLFSADFAFLQEMYNTINKSNVEEHLITCPKCTHEFVNENILAVGE